MPRAGNAGGLASSAFMKPFVVLALPGMYLFYKYNQYRRQQEEQNRRKVTERELAHLNHKIDKLLTKLEENEPELATSQEDECVICVNAKATMQTSPCGHRVVCRKCFVKTIQMAVSQRLLPLRCVICRAKILRLKQSSSGEGHGHGHGHHSHHGHGHAHGHSHLSHKASSSGERGTGNDRETGKWLLAGSSSGYSLAKPWLMPSSASQYSMGSHASSVPNSASLYSMTSGSSSLSGVSSVSSATNGSQGSNKYGATGSRMNGFPRQPTGSLRKSQAQSMKLRLQDYKEPAGRAGHRLAGPREILQPEGRLPPIKEFQREFRSGKERTGSCSTRIRCAQKIVTQLETPLLQASSSSYFRSPLKPSNKEDKRKGDKKKEDKKTKEDEKSEEKTSKKSEKKDGKNEKKSDKKIEKKDEKKDVKVDKKENKTEKKESKKEVKTEKKESKKEAKAEKKKEKKETKSEKKEKE